MGTLEKNISMCGSLFKKKEKWSCVLGINKQEGVCPS
jgi:hypothetical protein